MSNDSFIQEVNEEIRQERTKALWGRYGPISLIIVLVLIVFVAIYQIYTSWQNEKAAKAGDKMLAIIALEHKGDDKGVLENLELLKNSDIAAYSVMALMHEAYLLQKQGKNKEAAMMLQKAAAKKNIPDSLKYIALIRAAYILLDYGSLDDVKKCLDSLLVGPAQNSAQMILGYAQWRAGKNQDAVENFKKVVAQGQNLQDVTQARMMLELIENGADTGKNLPITLDIDKAKTAQTKTAPLQVTPGLKSVTVKNPRDKTQSQKVTEQTLQNSAPKP